MSTDVNTAEVSLAGTINDLAYDLLRSFKDEKNVFISPFSISTALALVYLGADGSTAQSMRRVLKYDKYGLSEQDVHEQFMSLLRKLKQASNNYELSIYNGVLIQKDFHILDAYEKALTQKYNAQIESVDFENSPEEAKAKVNAEVDRATRGKINQLLDEPPKKDTMLFLLNAVYFYGNWENAFDRNLTTEWSFFNNGFDEKNVQMMSHDGEFRFGNNEELDATLVVLPYKGDNSAHMIIMLPNSRTGVAELQQRITKDSFDKALSDTCAQRIMLRVPKFSLTYSSDLSKPLAGLGLEELFGEFANLTRMAGDGVDLSVTSAVHKATIDVNEEGSEAAAATGFECGITCMPPEVTVEHPFLYFIREPQSGVLLFTGRVDEL